MSPWLQVCLLLPDLLPSDHIHAALLPQASFSGFLCLSHCMCQMGEMRPLAVTETFKDSSPGGSCRPGRMVRSSWQDACTAWDRPEPSLPAGHRGRGLGMPQLHMYIWTRKSRDVYLPSTRRVGWSQRNSKQLMMGISEDGDISGLGQPTVPATSQPCWALA